MANQWKNALGESVPASAISAFDKKKERVVQKIFKTAEKISSLLHELDGMVETDLRELWLQKLKSKGVEPSTKKGNFTFHSYDKNIKVEVNVNDLVEFNDNISIAQQKLQQYINQITQDSEGGEIRTLINAAFTTRKGGIDRAKVVSLFALDIKHPLWQEAMELIKSSMEVKRTKRYATVWKANDKGEYEQVPLNFSSL